LNAPLLKSIVSSLFIFNKKPIEAKVLALAIAFEFVSYRKVSRIVKRLLCKLSKSSIAELVKRFSRIIRVAKESKERRLVAIDETAVKANGYKVWIYSAIDCDTMELISVYVALSRFTSSAYKLMVDVKRYSRNKPLIVSDRAPWLKEAALRSGLRWKYERFGDRSKVERVFRYVKDFSRSYFSNVNVRGKRLLPALESWNRFCRRFELWYITVRG